MVEKINYFSKLLWRASGGKGRERGQWREREQGREKGRSGLSTALQRASCRKETGRVKNTPQMEEVQEVLFKRLTASPEKRLSTTITTRTSNYYYFINLSL